MSRAWSPPPPSPPPYYGRNYYRSRERYRSLSPDYRSVSSDDRKRASRYRPPIGRDGNHLSIDVNLLSLADDNHANIRPSPVSKPSSAEPPEIMCIETSRGYVDDNGVDTVVLTMDLKSSTNEPHIRWIHLQEEYMSFEGLQKILVQTPDLNSDDVLIALRLLRQAQENGEKQFIHGHYLEPMILRCDSRDISDRQKPDRSCTFSSFPYFSLQSTPTFMKRDGVHLHTARALMQTYYYLEATKSRDADQVICKTHSKSSLGGPSKAIHVPQVWSMILGSDTVITYSATPVTTLLGNNIQISKPISTIRTGASVLRVTDPFERLFFFSLDQCKTWFELTDLIYKQCLRSYGYLLDECEIFLKDEKPVSGIAWASVIEAEQSPFLDLFVKFKEEDSSDEDDESGSIKSRAQIQYKSFDERQNKGRTAAPPEGSSMALIQVRQEDARENSHRNRIQRRSKSRPRSRRDSPPDIQRRGSRGRPTNARHQRDRELAIRPRSRSRSRSRALGRRPRHLARNGIVVNEEKRNDTDSDIYYVPEKGKKKDIPAVNITRTDSSVLYSSVLPSGANGKQGPNETSSSVPEPASSDARSDDDKPRKRRRSGSSSRTAAPLKPSVLPILMWPTGATEVEDGTKGNDAGGAHFSKKKKAEPQSASANLNSPNGAHNPDLSLAEVLERIHDRLLTDAYFDHHTLFQEMEEAQLREALFSTMTVGEPTAQATDGIRASDNKLKPDADIDPARSPTVPLLRPSKDSESTEKQLKDFSDKSKALLEAFVPANYSTKVTGRYYGAMKRIITLIVESHNHYCMSKETLDNNDSHTVWVIQDISKQAGYLKKNNLQPPPVPLSTCARCKANVPYKSEEAAAEHLRRIHFLTKKTAHESAEAIPMSQASHWINSFDRSTDKRRYTEHMKILARCYDHIISVHKQCQEIQDGVSTNDKAHQSRYRLPKAFVEGFRRLVTLLVYTCHVLDIVNDNYKGWGRPNWGQEQDDDFSNAMSHLDWVGYGAETGMERGKLDLLLMLRTQDYTQSVRYEAVGPQYILAMVMTNLQGGVDCKGLLDIYKEYTARLAFQVSQYPRKRLLRDFTYLDEELTVIQETLSKQWDLLMDFDEVLRPHTFRVTSETRRSMWPVENTLLYRTRTAIIKQQDEIDQLDGQIARLISQTKMSVEILDDDHGKAILVFTVVTLIFLPLSFVTSFLGMNTVDIRDQNSSQWVFWAAALPLTGLIVALALLVAYRYDWMRERALQSRRKISRT